LDGLPGYIFQQDNARPHIANVSRMFLEESLVPTLPWPARSPDLSPIEHVWDNMGLKLRLSDDPPNNLHELRQQLQIAWDAIPQQEIDDLIRSMPRRVNACIRVRGDMTNY